MLFEYQPGGTLRETFRSNNNNNGLQKSDLFKYSTQIVEGLEFLHSKDVVHGDISLDNILITSNGDVILCDLASSALEGHKLPETSYELRSKRPYVQNRIDVVDDIFAVGSILFEMETGQAPFHDKSPEKVKKLYSKGIFPSTHRLKLHPIIQKCWHSQFLRASEVRDEICMCSLLFFYFT